MHLVLIRTSSDFNRGAATLMSTFGRSLSVTHSEYNGNTMRKRGQRDGAGTENDGAAQRVLRGVLPHADTVERG